MTTTATTTERKNKVNKAAKPAKFVTELAARTLYKLGADEWSMTITSQLMLDGVTHHSIYFVLNEDKCTIISPTEIEHITAFASVVSAFGWYITKDYDTKRLAIKVSISTRKLNEN